MQLTRLTALATHPFGFADGSDSDMLPAGCEFDENPSSLAPINRNYMPLVHLVIQKMHVPISSAPAGHTMMTKGLQADILALTPPPFKVTEEFPPV